MLSTRDAFYERGSISVVIRSVRAGLDGGRGRRDSTGGGVGPARRGGGVDGGGRGGRVGREVRRVVPD